MEIHIYTDGGCSGNPGPGGWAYVIVTDRAKKPVILAEQWGAERSTTNNRMEIHAVIAALEGLAQLKLRNYQVTVYTDSQYVQKGMSEWIHSWKANGWRNSSREPVKNRELWEKLDSLAARFPVAWKWVRGHSGDVFNEHCDRLTREAVAALETKRRA
jgi:ribonuclease HI